MREYDEHPLDEAALKELSTLVDALDAGEDVTLVAFQRLCPTGQEGAFDQNAVFIYQTLAEEGFIDGVCEDGEFFFEDITERGIKAVQMPATPDCAECESESESGNEDIDLLAESAEEPMAQEIESKPTRGITKAFESGELTLPIAAGFIAGLIGGALSAVIVWAII